MGLIFSIAFIVMGVVDRSKPTSMDLTIAKFFTSHRTPSEIRIAGEVSTATAPIIIGLLAIGLLAIWIYRKERRVIQDFTPAALIVTAGIASTLAKPIFHRVRPGMNFSTIYDAEPSFPSSHTVFIAVAGSALLFVFAKRHLLIISIISVATLFIGLDRLVLGVHWFTDLIGSVFLSAGLYFLFAFLHGRVRQNSYGRSGAS
jgi:membrane-associated phospholipid phosphatase